MQTTTVLHVITGLGSGGAERMLVRVILANRSRRDVRQLVISLLDDGVYVSELRQAGVELHCLGLSSFSRLPAAFIRLVMLMRRIRPDIVMTWLYHADFVATLAAVVSGIGVRRIIWNVRCSNLELSNYAWTTRFLVSVLTRLSPFPGAVATNSRSGRQVHEALGYRPRRWVLLPNGLDLNEFRPCARDGTRTRAELGVSSTAPVIGLIARVDPQKDHATFLAAAKVVTMQHPHARFILAGRGTERIAVPDEVLSLGERRDVPSLMRALDIAVVCSAYGEGFPNVLLEAMATGLNCIATDVGDAAAICESAGVLVAPRNPEALAAAINSLLSESPRLRRSRGRRARSLVRRKYSLQSATNRYQSLWASLSEQTTTSKGKVSGIDVGASEIPARVEKTLSAQ